MMVSGAFAVTVLSLLRHQRVTTAGFAVLTAVLLYALVANILEIGANSASAPCRS